jgi:hypothetical protein
MKGIFQSVVVNKSRAQAQRVRAELDRIGNVRWLAAALNRSYGTVSNLLSGCNRGESTKREIELILNLPVWSSANDFVKRLDTPAKIQAYKRAIFERLGGQLAGRENFCNELQALVAQLGMDIVGLLLPIRLRVLSGRPQTPTSPLPRKCANHARANLIQS